LDEQRERRRTRPWRRCNVATAQESDPNRRAVGEAALSLERISAYLSDAPDEEENSRPSLSKPGDAEVSGLLDTVAGPEVVAGSGLEAGVLLQCRREHLANVSDSLAMRG
jgi:hypothetical protein